MSHPEMTTQDYIAEKLAIYAGCDDEHLIRELAEAAVDYHRAYDRRDDVARARHAAQYARIVEKLGFDPLI